MITEVLVMGQRYGRVDGPRYVYAADKCRCPVCQGLGAPWAGWFTCDECPAVALVDGGDVFLPVAVAA